MRNETRQEIQKANNRKLLIALLVALLLLAVFSVSAVFTFITYRENQRLLAEAGELTSRLDAVSLELTVRRVDTEQKLLAAQTEEERESTERENRLALKNRFLERDRDELLNLVNPWNSIDENLEVRLCGIGDGMFIDERCAGALRVMLEDCKKAGGYPCPISTYRTQDYQQELFDDKVQRVIAAGTSVEDAPAKAAMSVAVPGTSEHQLGLAVDIVDEWNPNLDYSQEWTGTQRWLMEHCWEYGFILRYPNETSDITGIIYEPWHYRYVGKAAAAEITALGVTFEEYLQGRTTDA